MLLWTIFCQHAALDKCIVDYFLTFYFSEANAWYGTCQVQVLVENTPVADQVLC